MRVLYKTTKATLLAVRNSIGVEYRVGSKIQYNETGELVTVFEILAVSSIHGGEYRIRLKDDNGVVFASFDIEYAPQFLTAIQ